MASVSVHKRAVRRHEQAEYRHIVGARAGVEDPVATSVVLMRSRNTLEGAEETRRRSLWLHSWWRHVAEVGCRRRQCWLLSIYGAGEAGAG